MEIPLNQAITLLYRSGVFRGETLLSMLKRADYSISKTSVFDKLGKLKEGLELVDSRANNSRPTILREPQLNRIEDALKGDPELTANELKRELRLNCSSSTIRRTLNKLGYKYLRIIQTPYLSKRNK